MQRRLLDRFLLALVRRSWTVSQRLTISVPAVVEGVPLRVPLIYGVGLQNLDVAAHDRPLARAVRAVFDYIPGGVIDVGCNIGHFMELCVLADRSRPYAGFDPSLACCFYVQRFILENRLPAHTVFPIGLGRRSETDELQSDGPFDVCASFSREAHHHGRFRQRSLMRIELGDNVVRQLPFDRLALIKIDVEGLELDVLHGLARTIREQRPFVLFEVLVYANLGLRPETGAGQDPAQLRAVAEHRRRHALALGRFFRERDYLVFKLRRNGDLNAAADLDPGAASDSVEMDHLAVPREHAEGFLRIHHDLLPGWSAGAAAA
jgi:FkbM family methyltransferase